MWFTIFKLIGGIGFLIYGIEIMKDALEKTTSGRTQKLLETSPKNTYLGILTGAVATMINQKSSATTIMVVGFVNAGMMTLTQAAGVIMGANIGTTVTAQFLAFRLETLAPLIVGAAAILWRYTNNKRIEYVAEILMGFGMMFIGMYFLELGFSEINAVTSAQAVLADLNRSMTSIGGYLLMILAAFIVTQIIRSSSVMTGIMIAAAAQGLLSIEVAMPMILGLNVGKCINAIVSSRGANRTAKRAAAMHLIFNLVGAVIVVIFFRTMLQDLVVFLSPDNTPRMIANAHSLFNIGNTILFLPFVKLLVLATDKIIPIKKHDMKQASEINLDIRMLETPGIALAQAYSELIEMTKAAVRNYGASFKALMEADEKLATRIFQEEETINKMQKELEVYLVKLSQKNISKDQHEKLNLMIGIAGDVERIGDLAENIAQLGVEKRNSSLTISESAEEELNDLHSKVMRSAEEMIEALRTNDTDLAKNIIKREENINAIEQELREKHIERLNQGVCAPGSGVLFIDVISNMERIADHIKNIGAFIINISRY